MTGGVEMEGLHDKVVAGMRARKNLFVIVVLSMIVENNVVLAQICDFCCWWLG